MNGYLLCIIGTVLISAVLTAIMPEGKTTAVIKGIAKLACLLVIVAPIPRFLQGEDFFDTLKGENQENSQTFFPQSVIQTDGAFIKYYSETRILQTEKAVEDELLEKYGVKSVVALKWSLENELDIRIEQIRVTTEQEEGEEVKKEMWEYLTNNYCSEVLIE